MSRGARLAILVLTCVMLGGCSGAATTPASAGPTGEPTTTASPVPTVQPSSPVSPSPAVTPSPDLSPLATTYTAIAAGATAALHQCDEAATAVDRTLADAKAVARSCRDGYLKYIAALKAVAWGPAQPQADALIAAATACDAIVVTMINATDGAAFRAAYARLTPATNLLVQRANAIRKVLGLPPSS